MSCPVVDLDSALGITRDGLGIVAHVPKHRFTKTQFPAQEIKLPNRTVKFHVPRQNDHSAGASVGIFETDDDDLAKTLRDLVAASPKPLFIQYQSNP